MLIADLAVVRERPPRTGDGRPGTSAALGVATMHLLHAVFVVTGLLETVGDEFIGTALGGFLVTVGAAETK